MFRRAFAPARLRWVLAALSALAVVVVVTTFSGSDEPSDRGHDGLARDRSASDEVSRDPSPPDEPVEARPGPAEDAEVPSGDAGPEEDRRVEDDLGAVEAPDADDVTDARAEVRRPLVIHHVGDVSLDATDVPVIARGDHDGAWDGVRDTFADADLVLANLECAASDGGTPQDKSFVFRCSPDALPAMRDAGVDVVNLANNHSGDLGIDGMLDSVTNVEAAGMASVGVGRDEPAAYRPHVVEVEGWSVAILGFGGVVPSSDWTARGALPGQATGYDAARMAEAVAAAAEAADVVIVSVHWGTEGAVEPRPEDVLKADALIAAGADVVFGHHAHRLQPLEVVDDVPVFWNLGNFVWPRLSVEAATTAVAEYRLDPDGTVSSCLLPFAIDQDGVPRPTGADRECTAPNQHRGR